MSFRVGILGFAHGHVHTYCSAWRDRPELGISVAAGWDDNASRLGDAEKAYGLTAFKGPEELLSRGDIQGVVIAAETAHHARLVEAAAAAGKTIVLQKPLALTIPEADRIVNSVNKHGTPFSLAWQMRVDPQNLEMRELVQSGELGKLFLVRRRHTLATHLWKGFADLWHNSPTLNRDIFADDAAHAVDFILWLLGAPETVSAELATLCDPQIPNDNGIALYRYPNGPIAEVVGSFVSAHGENTTEITAEKGIVIQNYGDAPSCGGPRPEGAVGLKWYSVEKGCWTYSDSPIPQNQGVRIGGLSVPLAEFMTGKRPPIATAEEGRTALRMVLACYLSSSEGRRVRIDDPGIDAI